MTRTTVRKEIDAKAELGLHYCDTCKLFLPKIKFGTNKYSRFGIAFRCRTCERKRKRIAYQSKSYRRQLNEEREQKAKENLYHCNSCQKYLPPQLFYKNICGKFGLGPKCKFCRHPPENRKMIVHLKIPRSTKENIRRLSILYDKSIKDTLLELIIEGLKNAQT